MGPNSGTRHHECHWRYSSSCCTSNEGFWKGEHCEICTDTFVSSIDFSEWWKPAFSSGHVPGFLRRLFWKSPSRNASKHRVYIGLSNCSCRIWRRNWRSRWPSQPIVCIDGGSGLRLHYFAVGGNSIWRHQRNSSTSRWSIFNNLDHQVQVDYPQSHKEGCNSQLVVCNNDFLHRQLRQTLVLWGKKPRNWSRNLYKLQWMESSNQL